MLFKRSAQFGAVLAFSLPALGSGEAPAERVAPPPLSIHVEGDNECRSDVVEAMGLLWKRARDDYAMVVGAIGVIKCVERGSGMEAYANPPKFLLGDTTRNASVTWLAGSIVHDATHSKLYHDYRRSHPGPTEVPSSIWIGESAEAICLKEQAETLVVIGAPQFEVNTVNNALSSRYWEVSSSGRSW